MGVSWTQERPPLYSDVPPSPPTYKHGDVDDCPEYENLPPLESLGTMAESSRARAQAASGSPAPIVRRRLSMTDLEQDEPTSGGADVDAREESSAVEIESGDIYDN